jgi:DNA-binding response OmpR family regulator
VGIGKILVLENDVDIIAIMMIILEDSGFDAFITTAVTIYDDIASISPDLLILDYGLYSTISGLDICTRLRILEDPPLLEVILVSAFNNLDKLAESCNASAYIVKPFDIVDFCNTVKDIMSI